MSGAFGVANDAQDLVRSSRSNGRDRRRVRISEWRRLRSDEDPTAEVEARVCVDDPHDAADLGRLRRDRRSARVVDGGARLDVSGAAQ